MTQALAVMEPQQIVNVSESALSIDQIVKQRLLITECMAKAMKEGEHYGVIPGCGEKPSLKQPGAQLLAHLFRLRPEYDVIETDLPHDHKRYRLTCRLFFIGSVPEIKIGEGVGESSSMESKHRFRNAAAIVEPTGHMVPKTYWNIKHEQGNDAANKWLGTSYDGEHVGVRKIDGQWMVVLVKGSSDDKIENPNPADVFNTVLKIAKKRAFVDAVITATASSDFFTQDLEDIRENLAAVETSHENGQQANAKTPVAASEEQPAATQPRTRKAKPEALPKLNGPKHEVLYTQLKEAGVTPDDFMEAMRVVGRLPEHAKNFGKMTDETAGGFLVDMPAVLEVAKNFVAQKGKAS